MKAVYFFGQGHAEGRADMKNLLGGKGANLAEMTNLGIPVPPGFTITTEVCNYYYAHEYSFPEDLQAQINDAMKQTEAIMGKRFGNKEDPLLISVRSGARESMPGMMDTVLNIGLTSQTIPGLISKTGNPRLVYDTYRRLIMMYSDVVMEKAQGITPADGQNIRTELEKLLYTYKQNRRLTRDIDLTAEDWQEITIRYKAKIHHVFGYEMPDDPQTQLWGAIEAVFLSWFGKRAVNYRRIENISEKWGTAVSVQAMVFGNTGMNSATGVAFTRNPANGKNHFYGEWLPNAQGEDIVAGTRTPHPLNKNTKTEESDPLDSLEKLFPKEYAKLYRIRTKLETHYRDMQDLEFTIEDGRLWMLQTRRGKRSGLAAIQIAVDMVHEKLISKEEALMRVKPAQVDEILHPMLDPEEEKNTPILAKGLPAGPGGAIGQIVFNADDAETWAEKDKIVILVREETSPEDVHGMHAAVAILTAKGGMTSHAALVARGWGKCCIVGCSSLAINLKNRSIDINGTILKEGDWISMNGSNGNIYGRKISLKNVDPELNHAYSELMVWADKVRTLDVRANADQPVEAEQARSFGAEGIGLCRTEHMFFDPDRIMVMRKMILAESEEERRTAVMDLLPFQREDFKGILLAMKNLPVTIRLLDPPLNEFINLNEDQIITLAHQLDVPAEKIRTRISFLHEFNPMLGHRGCRLGVTFPEITEMQSRAIFEATAFLTKKGVKVLPEVMIPLVGTFTEFENQEKIVRTIAEMVMKEQKIKFDYSVGTMIELPRACLTADEIAQKAEFFSFGTNDLTQTVYGFSRDDIGKFLPDYLNNKLLNHDPFQSLDIAGVGQLLTLGVEKGRSVRKNLKIGICGEHGGDPKSIEFFHRSGLNYVSCSPFRVPVARLAAARAALKYPRKSPKIL